MDSSFDPEDGKGPIRVVMRMLCHEEQLVITERTLDEANKIRFILWLYSTVKTLFDIAVSVLFTWWWTGLKYLYEQRYIFQDIGRGIRGKYRLRKKKREHKH